MPTFGLHLSGALEAEEALRAFEPAVSRSFGRRLRDVARAVAADARGRAASWSRKIPPGIDYLMEGAGASVVYRGSAPEIGRLAELRGVWRHPLFGNRRFWYVQRGRPFLRPAAEGKEGLLVAEGDLAVEEAKREVGL